MPTISVITFDVQLQRTGNTLTVVMHDLSIYPNGALGIYTITEPDGYVRQGDFTSPDILSVVDGTTNIYTTIPNLRLSSTNEIQNGTYTFNLKIKTTDNVITSFTRTAVVGFKRPTHVLREEFDVFTPELKYFDDTNYQASNFNIVTTSRQWNVTSSAFATAITPTTASVDLAYLGDYYDATYTVDIDTDMEYQHQVYSWLSLTDVVSTTRSTYAETPPTILQFVTLISQLRTLQESLTDYYLPYKNTKADFEYAQALFVHILDKIKNGDMGSIYVDLKELIYVLHNNHIPAYTATNLPIGVYDLSTAGGGAWGTITGTITNQTDLVAYIAAQITANNSVYDSDLDGVVDESEKMVTWGRNSTGATLYKGTIVYILGSTGNRPNFVKAQANSEATSAGTFGVIIADIANNSDGKAATIGTLHNLDTRTIATNPFTDVTLADGDTLYLHPTIAGYVTNVKPSAPNHIVYVGKVVRTHPTLGTIVYRIQNGYELSEIHDVSITTPSNGQVLQYNSTTGLWNNATISTDNIYTANGTLTGNRVVSLSTYTLDIATNRYDATNSFLNYGGGSTFVGHTSIPTSAGKLDVNGTIKSRLSSAGNFIEGVYSGTTTFQIGQAGYGTFNSGLSSPKIAFFDQGQIGYSSDGYTLATSINQAGLKTLTFLGDLRFGSSSSVNSVFHFSAQYGAGGTYDTRNIITIATTNGNSLGRATGTGTNNILNITPAYNYTGTATGTVRGIYYNPTLTSMTGVIHNAIENVTGDNLFNTTSGSSYVGYSTAPTGSYKFGVNGTSIFNDLVSFYQGGNNFIQFIPSANGVAPYIRLFFSGAVDSRIYIATSNTIVGAKSILAGYTFNQTNASTYGGIVAHSIGALNGVIAVTNTGADALFHVASPSGYSAFISFRENGVADKGLIGYANGSNDLQIRVNGATSMTTGTLAATFYSTGNVQFGSATGLNWDNTNGRLGIGTSSPADILDIRKNQVTTSVATTTSLLVSNTNASGIAAIAFTSDGTTRQGGLQYNNTTGQRNLFSCTYTQIPYYFGTNSLIRLTVTGDTGNILINTTTDGGQRLQVIGSMRVGTTAASAMYWDDTNNRLGIGTSSPSYTVDIPANNTSLIQHRVGTFQVQSYALNNGFMSDNMYFNGTTWTRTTTGLGYGFQFYNGQLMLHGVASGTGAFTQNVKFKFDYEGAFIIGNNLNVTQGNYSGATALFTKTGNLLLNTTTDGGQLLQVIGSMRVGTTAASAMYWDDTNNRLGVGTSSPGYTLDVSGRVNASSSILSGPAHNLTSTQTQLNSTDTGDATLKVDYTLNGSGAGTQLVTRVFQLSNNHAYTSATISNFRVFNLSSSTQTSTTVTDLDQIYIERGTANGTVTRNRGVFVNNLQGTTQIAFAVNAFGGSNNVGLLIGGTTNPSGNWGVYASDVNYNNAFAGGMVVGGTSLSASAILQSDSTTKGFLPPRMTGAQVEAIASPATGLLAYATSAGAGAVTSSGWWGYDGTTWVKLN